MRSVLWGLWVLLSATPALAQHERVRDDIVDLRHDRWPGGRVLLGWTADNRAVVHAVASGTHDGSGAPFATASLEVIAATKQPGSVDEVQRTPLLDLPCEGCGADRADADPPGPAWVIPTEVASRAIRAERAALDALGPLQPSAVGERPVVKIVAHSCRIDLLVGRRLITGMMTIPRASCIADGGDSSFRDAHLDGVALSPDRQRLAVTFTVQPRTFEWGDPFDVTVVVDAD
ncbi:MAG TPA: hypothetical protein VFP84_33085 [Kofleriaceae bacterium]|nr:hypothetical protein [Kofleriaceae bacterium]